MRKPGCIEPVIFFVCGSPSLSNPPRPIGYVLIAPYSDCPTPEGYRREEADTLSAVDRLEKTLQQQEHENAEREGRAHEEFLRPLQEKVRSRLRDRVVSSATSDYEKDFIRLWFQLRDDHPRKKFYAEQFHCYLHARHNMTPKNRGVDEEKFSPDRINA